MIFNNFILPPHSSMPISVLLLSLEIEKKSRSCMESIPTIGIAKCLLAGMSGEHPGRRNGTSALFVENIRLT
jgi:hypothetical protein